MMIKLGDTRIWVTIFHVCSFFYPLINIHETLNFGSTELRRERRISGCLTDPTFDETFLVLQASVGSS